MICCHQTESVYENNFNVLTSVETLKYAAHQFTREKKDNIFGEGSVHTKRMSLLDPLEYSNVEIHEFVC